MDSSALQSAVCSSRTIMSLFGKVVKGLSGGSAGTVIQFGDCQAMLTSQLAEGGYSYVYSAREVGMKGRQFAAKKVLAQDAETRAVAEVEMKLLQQFNGHKAFVGCYGTTSKALPNRQHEYWMLLEFCPNGSLIDVLYRKNKKGEFEKKPLLPPDKLLKIFEQVVAGVAHMHSCTPPVAHRDLKLENVLGTADARYVLCDFGSATTSRLEIERSRQQIVVEEERIHKYSTLMYRAPEMCDLYLKAAVCEKVDCWALGCILFALCFGDHPFDTESMLQILNAAYTIPNNHDRPKSLVLLVDGLLEPDPDHRLSAAETLEWVQALLKDINAPRPSPESSHRRDQLDRREKEREEQRKRGAHPQARIELQQPPHRNEPRRRPGQPATAPAARWSADFGADNFDGFDDARLVSAPAVPRLVTLSLEPTPDGKVRATLTSSSIQPIASSSSAFETGQWEASFEPSFEPSFGDFNAAPTQDSSSASSALMSALPPPPAAPTLPPPPDSKAPHSAAPAAADANVADDEFGEFSGCIDREDSYGAFTGGQSQSVSIASVAAANNGTSIRTGDAVTIPESPAAESGELSSPVIQRQQSRDERTDEFGDFAGAGAAKSAGEDSKPTIPGGDLD